MVKFSKTIATSRKPEWKQYYLDYERLKKRLLDLRDTYNYDIAEEGFEGTTGERLRRTMSRAPSLAVLARRNSVLSGNTNPAVNSEEDSFVRLVDAEVEKVVLFFLATQGSLASKLLHARQALQNDVHAFDEEWKLANVPVSGDDTQSKHEASFRRAEAEYFDVGQGIVDLLRFLQLNVAGLRKILKKHDKQVRDRLMASNYLASRARARYAFLQQLYHNEGVLALVASLRAAFEQVHIFRLPGAEAGFESAPMLSLQALETTEPHTQEQRDLFEELAFAQTQLAEEQRRTVRDYLTLSSDLVLEQGYAVEEPHEQSKKRELDKFSAMINLATTFLYMSNYYIVAPSSTEYAAALGGSPAVSGVIIGMTPIAACVSCIFYSYWSNTSFRQPLVLSAVMLVIGNGLYGIALSFNAFWMALLGRTLIGFGGTRGVCRRYIADTIPLEQRTSYSAAFVAVGATGMAFGPFAAALVNDVDFTVGIAIVNGMTAPGWLMAVAWLLLGVLTLFFFKEPTYRFTPPAKPVSAKKQPQAAAAATRSINDGAPKIQYGATSTNSSARVDSEHQGLLSLSTHSEMTNDSDEDDAFIAGFYCCGVLPLPLFYTLMSYFVNKLVTEAVVSGAPLLTGYMFDWGVSSVGMLMAALGMVVLPVNVLVGRLSLTWDDRFLMQALMIICCAGCLAILQIPGVPYTETQYVLAVFFIFVTLQAHEGVLMSVTSKIIPPELAKGTFNSGFLATEAGTFARFVGDMAVTLVGIASMEYQLELLFIPSFMLCVLVLLGGWLFYPVLDV